MQLIAYRGEQVTAVVNGDLAVMAPTIEALGADDPLGRFVAAMCRFAMELELGIASGAYSQRRGGLRPGAAHARRAVSARRCLCRP
jgi:hypothetical protein